MSRLVTYDFECDCGVWEDTVEYEKRDDLRCVKCGQGERLMCAPAIHTLETHMRGYRGDNGVDAKATGQGYYNPGFGEFIDENLTDPATGNPMRYSTLKEKEACLRKAGKFQKGDISSAHATTGNSLSRSKKPIVFTKEGRKTSRPSS